MKINNGPDYVVYYKEKAGKCGNTYRPNGWRSTSKSIVHVKTTNPMTNLPGMPESINDDQFQEVNGAEPPKVTPTEYDLTELDRFVRDIGPEEAADMIDDCIHWFTQWLSCDRDISNEYTAAFLYNMTNLRNAFRDTNPELKNRPHWHHRI